MRIPDPNQYHALYQALNKADQDFSKFFQGNHAKLEQSLKPQARILISGCYHGQEMFSLSAINKDWHLVGLEPEPAFLRTATRRAEALDLESRMEFHDFPLSQAPSESYDAAISSFQLHFQKEPGTDLEHIQKLKNKLTPGGHLLVTVVVEPDQGPDKLAEQLAQPKEMIKGILKLSKPLPAKEVKNLFAEAGFQQINEVGRTALLGSYLLVKA